MSRTGDGVALFVHVTPRARRARLGGVRGDALRVAVTAPPADGQANGACARALAKALGVRRDQVHLDPGSRGRRKRVRLTGDPARLEARLLDLASKAPVG